MTGRDRTVLAGLAVLAVLAGFWFLVVAPRRTEVSDLNTKVTAARVAAQDAEQRATLGAAAKRTYGHDLAVIAELGKATPAVDDSASLLYQLQDAAGRSKVAITAVTPNADASATGATAPAPLGPGGMQAVPIKLSFEGSYADLERFLRRIHRFTSIGPHKIAVRGRLISVQSVDLVSADAGATPIRANIEALTYLAPAAAPTAAATGSASATSPSAAAPPATASSAPPTTVAAVGAG